MANHRWETEPPAVLPSRLAARRRAAGVDLPPPGGQPGVGTDSRGRPELEDTEAVWQLPDPEEDEPDSSTDPGVSFQNPRRWRFPLRAGILAACLMLAAAAAVPLLRDRASSEVLSVELGSNLATAGSGGHPAATGTPGPDELDEGQPQADRGTGQPDAPEAPGEPETTGEAGRGTQLVVHVAGAVGAPGLVRIPEGSRVADAVAAAGGATGEADLTRVNLAAPMPDGSMVVIPARGDPSGPVAAPDAGPPGQPSSVQPSPVQPSPGTPAGTGSGAGASVVNLNTAGEAELQTLPRVGPVLAARIIAWRTEHGPFQRAEDLDAVPGIGEAMLAALLPLVAV
ncbi:helix-hairpin-helix domain-containing protein [Arthrobacter sp. 3Tela_A]|uniref:helix-hairpin-helix domain-containing protein n=1 Tax=Arthrobacter sp. 3Tela_A TaxID=3093743 RepID=UPI003BB54F3A